MNLTRFLPTPSSWWMMMTMEDYCYFRRNNNMMHTYNCIDLKFTSIEELTEAVRSNIPENQLWAANRLKNLLEIGPNIPYVRVIEAGVMQHFVSFLDRHDFPHLQVEAVSIFYIFANTTESIRNVVFRNDVLVRKLVNLIRVQHSPYETIRVSAIATLGSIAKYSSDFRGIVLHNQALESLLLMIRENNSDLELQIAASVLNDFCKGAPLSIERSDQVHLVLQQDLYRTNVAIIAAACRTLNCPSFRGMRYTEPNFLPDVYSRLVDLIEFYLWPPVMVAAIETVANILSDCENPLAQHLIGVGAIYRLGNVLKRTNDIDIDIDIIMAACRSIANITTENYNHTQAVVSVGIMPVLFQLFVRSNITQLKQQVALVISNFARHGTPLDVKSMSEHCIKPLCDMLDCSDNSLILNCLRGLDNILHLWRLEMRNNNDNFRNNIVMIEQVNGLQKIMNLGDPKAGPQNSIRCFATGMLISYWPHLADHLCVTSK